MTPLNLDTLSIEEKLLLQELLAEKIAAAIPDSLIQSQIVYHAQYMNNRAPMPKRVQRSMKGMK